MVRGLLELVSGVAAFHLCVLALDMIHEVEKFPRGISFCVGVCTFMHANPYQNKFP